MTENQKPTAEEVAIRYADANPGKRFAAAENGSAVAIFDEGKQGFVPILERTLFGTFVEGGVNVPRDWKEVSMSDREIGRRFAEYQRTMGPKLDASLRALSAEMRAA